LLYNNYGDKTTSGDFYMKNDLTQLTSARTTHTQSLNELIEQLGAHPGTPDNAKVINEIKGILEIYDDVDPVSAARVMERVAIKLAGALIDTLDEYFEVTNPGGNEIFESSTEWENGFEAYLLFNGKTEKTIEVYLRCIKRIMKNMRVADINEMLQCVDEYQCNGANERSALTQFDKCIGDGKGYVIVLDENGAAEQYVMWRGYNIREIALEELAMMREERQVLGKDPHELVLMDKLGNKIRI
jgi:hypothetical protein